MSRVSNLKAALCAIGARALLASSATAQSPAPQQQAQAKKQEILRASLALRAVAPCPNLIEDWEWKVAARRVKMDEDDLKRTMLIGANEYRQMYARTLNYDCSSEEFTREAAYVRNYAHEYWLAFSYAYPRLAECNRSPTLGFTEKRAAFQAERAAKREADPILPSFTPQQMSQLAQAGPCAPQWHC